VRECVCGGCIWGGKRVEHGGWALPSLSESDLTTDTHNRPIPSSVCPSNGTYLVPPVIEGLQRCHGRVGGRLGLHQPRGAPEQQAEVAVGVEDCVGVVERNRGESSRFEQKEEEEEED
jgi:hypothetical protein